MTLLRFSLGFLLIFMALFLIALVLIQRGRGGGLAGAFGGAGGQSAFGTKAGDVFTRITVVVAAGWILLCILAINVLGTTTSRISPALGGAAGQRVQSEIPATPPADDEAPVDKDKQATDAKPEGESTPPATPDDAGKPAAEAKPSAEPATEAAAPATEPATPATE